MAVRATINKDGVNEAVESNKRLFSKEQLKASRKFANRKDLLEILLEEDKQYSVAEVDEMIKKFMKGKVK